MKDEIKELTSKLEEANTARIRAEEALREVESKYSSLTEISVDVIFTLDTEGYFTYVSPAVKTVTGYSSEDLIGRSFKEMVSPEYQETALENYKRGLSGENTPPYEIEIRHIDGKTVPVELTGSCLYDHNGKAIGRIVIGHDITTRMKAEEALRISEQSLKDIFESVQDGISVLEPDLTIRHVNNVMNKWYEKNLPLVGKKCYEVYHNSNSPCDPCPSLRCLRSGITEWNVVKGLPGSPVEWIELFSYPIKDPKSGETTGVVESVRDITERMQANRQILELKEFNESIVNNLAEGIILENEDGMIQFANPAMLKMLGYEKKELLGKNWRILVPEDQIGVVLDANKRRSSGESDHYEMELVKKNGERISVLFSGVPQYQSGNYAGLLAAFVDITEQNKLRAQLRQSQKMDSVGRLAGGVAHDFNNMLGVILGHTEMAIEETGLTHPIHEHLLEIYSAAERSADLTSQLLAFARKQTITPRILDINTTVEDILSMLTRLIGENIELLWKPGADVWPIIMDPSQIDQILTNLSINARDAIAGVGRITIETGKITLDDAYIASHLGFKSGDYTLLSFSDNGSGMSNKTLNNLFEPFFTTKGVGQGTGLGLATVYGIVKQNDGFINVYSEPEKGTTFNILLPRYTTGEFESGIKSHVETSVSGEETILLVEDEPAILHLITMMLKQHGYKVIPAETPGEAIRLAGKYNGKIHLLITDVVMPEMNGSELAANILSLFPDIKQLFMSGYTANVIAHHGVLEDGMHFIQKPFFNHDLAAKVREVLAGV